MTELEIQQQRRINELTEGAKAMREWIDAVPKNTSLPTMPGFDRDWVDMVIDDTCYSEQNNASSVATIAEKVASSTRAGVADRFGVNVERLS